MFKSHVASSYSWGREDIGHFHHCRNLSWRCWVISTRRWCCGWQTCHKITLWEMPGIEASRTAETRLHWMEEMVSVCERHSRALRGIRLVEIQTKQLRNLTGTIWESSGAHWIIGGKRGKWPHLMWESAALNLSYRGSSQNIVRLQMGNASGVQIFKLLNRFKKLSMMNARK